MKRLDYITAYREKRLLFKAKVGINHRRARVVELVDTLVLGTSAAMRESSSLSSGTILLFVPQSPFGDMVEKEYAI